MKKYNLIYKIIVGITLFMPISIFLIYSAAADNVYYNYEIYGVEIADLSTFKIDDEYFIYTIDNKANYSGYVRYDTDLGTYGILINDKDIIKIDKSYYSVVKNILSDVKDKEVSAKKSWAIPFTVMVSLGAIGIVVLVIQGKMGWAKKYPRVAVLISLGVGTGILYIIDSVVGSILNVFLISLVSWCLYLLEYMFVSGKITANKREKSSSDLSRALADALKDYR